MPKVKNLILSFTLLGIATTASQAQHNSPVAESRPASPTVTGSATGGRVRFTAPSSVVQIRLEVYDSSGKKLFDNELRGGNVLDWHLQDGQAERINDGTYLCVVTVKNLSGKLTQKVGSVVVEAAAARLQPVEVSQLTAQQSQAVGPIEDDSSLRLLTEDEPVTTTVLAHNGEEGQVISGKGALTFRLGDFYSGKDREQMRLTEEGNLGIGMTNPQAKLDVDGFIRATQGIVFPDGSIQFSAAKKTFGVTSQNPGQFGKSQQSGQEHFETNATGDGTQNFIAKWIDNFGLLGNSIIFDNGTNVGIGTTSPAKKLDVRGGQIALDNSRFLYSRRTNGQFQEAFGIDSNDDIIFNRNSLVPGVDLDAPKASSALIFGTGAGKFFDVRNSANVAILRIVEATGNVGFTGLRTENNATSPNVIGGNNANSVTAGAVGATIGGGGEAASFNRVTDDFGTIGGGQSNRAGDNAGATNDRRFNTVGGGQLNTASGGASTVGGGGTNTARGDSSTVGGGHINRASGVESTVGGGSGNTASGLLSTVPGGFSNLAQGDYSFAAGRRAKANNQGAFVWADSTDADFTSTANDQFLIRATGNVGINTASPADMLQVAGNIRIGTGTTGCVKDADATVIAGSCSSDVRFKKQITPFASVIERITRLQPVHFYWRADEFKEKHFGGKQSYGLIAQEVEEVLPELVGEDESGYKVVNYSKLPLLMLQAIKDLQVENDSLHQQNASIDARLKAIEALIHKKAVKSSNRRNAKSSSRQIGRR